PIPFNTRTDSLLTRFGKPKTIEHSVDFCGKGPIMRGTQVMEGDTIYCDSVIIYRYDSLTISVDMQGHMEYYTFTMTALITMRGIQVGDTKEKIEQHYGTP